jgi:hypothetical protein
MKNSIRYIKYIYVYTVNTANRSYILVELRLHKN